VTGVPGAGNIGVFPAKAERDLLGRAGEKHLIFVRPYGVAFDD